MKRLLLLLLVAACSEPAPVDPNPGNILRAETGWYRGDLHFHTNHSEDAAKQGGDDLGPALVIADAYRDAAYLAATPAFTGDGLDFVAVTDHRTDASIKDPAFHHDHLIVIPGEEYGGAGHAGIWGMKSHVTADPAEGQSQNARHEASIAEAHAQGALFSINHPAQDNMWPWFVETIDAVEVWNAPWSAFWGETDVAEIDGRVGAETENDFIRAGVSKHGGGSNNQALHLWYAMLTRGLHPALVGGGDRHMLVMPGLPTTYVRVPEADRKAVGHDLGYEPILSGIKAKATFVSASPHGPQVELTATDPAGTVFPMGARLAPGKTYTVKVRVTRAMGGMLRLVAGPVLPDTGKISAKESIVFEQALAGGDENHTFSWSPASTGAWLHALVLVPRIEGELSPELERVKSAFDKLPVGKDLGSLVSSFGVLVDGNTLFSPEQCVPENWNPDIGQCVPADKIALSTYYVPDRALRLMNTWFEDGKPTQWSAGAMTSAFLAR